MDFPRFPQEMPVKPVGRQQGEPCHRPVGAYQFTPYPVKYRDTLKMPSDILSELMAIRDLVEELTGLPSRWNGQVIIATEMEMRLLQGKGALAQKQWACNILIHESLVTSSLRWRTLIHEMLHSVSAGLNLSDYRRLRGWEEAIVEALQRSFRPRILTRLNIDLDASIFMQLESEWVFNRYIDAMETLRLHLHRSSEAFYLELLRTPLADRMAHVRSLDTTAEYLQLFARTIGKLR